MSGIDLECISICKPFECAQYDHKAVHSHWIENIWHNRVYLYEILAFMYDLRPNDFEFIFCIYLRTPKSKYRSGSKDNTLSHFLKW